MAEHKERFRKAIYATVSSGAPEDGDFPFPREYRGVYLERRRESGFQLYNTLGIARGDKAAYARQALENYNFFGAPHVAIIHTDEALGIYGAIDCGAYVGNFMLAAQAAWPWHHRAGRAGAAVRPDPSAFRAWRRPAGGLRHIVRFSGFRSQDQQLPHHPSWPRGNRHVR